MNLLRLAGSVLGIGLPLEPVRIWREIPYQAWRTRIAAGDVVLWRGRGLVASAIRRRTQSEFTHASLVDRHLGRLWVFEAREFRGVQHVPLSSCLKKYGNASLFTHVAPDGGHLLGAGLSDYRAKPIPRVDRAKALEYCADRVGDPYGYSSIGRFIRSVLPWARILSSLDDDRTVWTGGHTAICSTLVALAIETTSDRDLVPFRSPAVTSPGDLSRSGLLAYVGDLMVE